MNQLRTEAATRAEFVSHANPDHWVEAHGDCLYRRALWRVRKPEVAEDLVQDTLLVAMRTHEKFGGHSTERRWLMSILENKICDHFRKLGRQISFTDLEFFSSEHSERFDAGGCWIHEHGPVQWKPESVETMKRAEFWQALHCALGKLPARVAAVFTMREMDDVPSKQICATLSISEANLWVMLHRARMALRQDLEAHFFRGKNALSL